MRIIENYNTGILNEPGKLPPDTFSLGNVENLRPNTDGHLIPAARVIEALFSSIGDPIEGLARKEHLLFVVIDGDLHVSIDGAELTQVDGVSGLGGRVSLIDNYQEFVVIKTEEGLPYWIDISDESDITGHLLSLPKPTFTTSETTFHTSATTAPDRTKYYYYRFTYATDEEYRFGMVESEASEVVESEPITETPDPGDVIYRRFTVEFPTELGDIAELRLYRSDGYDEEEEDPKNFRLVDTAASDATHATDGLNETEQADGDELDINNRGMPGTAKSVTYYNGLLFAPNIDELRYNDRRLGESKLHIWPAANQLNYPATWAISLQGYLYFGDRENTWVLSGTGEGIPPFQVRRVDTVGALNRHCAGITNFGLTIIAATGMWVSQGSGFTKISTGLDEVFRHTQIIDGSMLQLPDRTVLFDVQLADDTRKQYIAVQVSGAIAFFAWSGIDMVQGVNLPIDTADLTMTAGGTEWTAGGVVWLFDSDGPELTRTFIARTGEERLSEVEWNSEDTHNEASTWKVESNDVFHSRKMQMARKRFRRMILNAIGEGEVTAVFDVDDTEITKTVELRDGKPTRIPIRRRGRKMKFELSGMADETTEIRGIRIEYDPLREY